MSRKQAASRPIDAVVKDYEARIRDILNLLLGVLEQVASRPGLSLCGLDAAYIRYLADNRLRVSEASIREAISSLSTVRPTTSPEEVDEAVERARLAGRNEALQAVIDGLELRDYGYTAPNEYPRLRFYSAERSMPETERLWGDLQTAIQVRSERREADKRAATEKSVSEITKPRQFFYVPVIDSNTVGDDATLNRTKAKKGGKAK